ncbi:hypothetical protein AOLI_G00142400 [Acnodon oligacanthus]
MCPNPKNHLRRRGLAHAPISGPLVRNEQNQYENSLPQPQHKGRLSCTICDQTQLVRLDLTNTHKITGKELEQMLKAAKRECIIQKLAGLRSRAALPLKVNELNLGTTMGESDTIKPVSGRQRPPAAPRHPPEAIYLPHRPTVVNPLLGIQRPTRKT